MLSKIQLRRFNKTETTHLAKRSQNTNKTETKDFSLTFFYNKAQRTHYRNNALIRRLNKSNAQCTNKLTHYENMPIQIYRKFYLQKHKIFR